MQRFLVVLSLLIPMLPCFADCDSLANVTAAKTHPELKLYPGLVACKAMPDDKAKTILVLAFESNGSPIVENPRDRDVEILVIGDNGKSIDSQLFRKNAWSDDAFIFSGVTIDTARYKLSRKDRAFGVRLGHSNSHYGGSGSTEELELLVAHKENIIPVLSLETYSRMQWNEQDSDGCSFSLVEIKRTLTMAKTRSYDDADIIIYESKHSDGARLVQGDCKKSDVKTKKKYLLRFDGKRYPDLVSVSTE